MTVTARAAQGGQSPQHMRAHPPRVRPAPSARTPGTDANLLAALQRSAGNAAVQRMLQASAVPRRSASPLVTARNPVPLQRCGPTPCDCSDDERDSHHASAVEAAEPAVQRLAIDSRPAPVPTVGAVRPAPVQRGVLGSIVSAVVPDWIERLVRGIPDTVRAVAATMHGRAGALGGAVGSRSASAGARARSGMQSAVGAATRGASQQGAQAGASAQQAETQSTTAQHQSLGALDSLSGVANLGAGLLNPALPTVNPSQVGSTLGRATTLLGQLPGGIANLGQDIGGSIRRGLKADGQAGWNCDQAEIMSMVGGVGRAVTNAFVRAGSAVLGPQRLAQLSGWTQGKIQDVRDLAAGIQASVRDGVRRVNKWWQDNVGPYLARLRALLGRLQETFRTLMTKVKKKIVELSAAVGRVLTAVRKTVIDPTVTWIQQKIAWVKGAVRGAISRLGSWWHRLPSLLKKMLLGAAVLLTGPAGIALAAAYAAARQLIAHKKQILGLVKAMADRAASAFGAWYQRTRKQVSQVWRVVSAMGRRVGAAASAAARWVATTIRAHTPRWVTSLLAGLAALRAKIGGAVCTALGDVAGPCVDQFVPDPGADAPQGSSHNVTLNATGALSVPVEGVPVKVNAGSSVALSRVGHKYTVVITGDGLIGVATPGGGGGTPGVTATAVLPGGVNASTSGPPGGGVVGGAWHALTGHRAPAPATAAAAPAAATAAGAAGAAQSATSAAAAGQAPAQPAKPGGGPEASAEAGYKASLEMTYEFDGTQAGADKTCDGVGGMVTMLAELGLSRALPTPFNSLAGGAVNAAFADHVTGCKATLAEYGKAEVDLKKDGIGGLHAAVSGEAGITVGQARNDKGEWVDTATVFGSLGGEVGANLLLSGNPKIDISAAAGVAGRLEAVLAYNQSTESISAMSVGGSLSLEVPSGSAGAINAVFPSEVGSIVLAQLARYHNLGAGKIKATASLVFGNLQDLLASLDEYFSTNGANSTAQGALDVIADYAAGAGNVTTSLVVTLDVTQTLAGVGLGVDGGKGASASVGLSVTENQSVVLYPAAP